MRIFNFKKLRKSVSVIIYALLKLIIFIISVPLAIIFVGLTMLIRALGKENESIQS